ncbi:hypothetical protein HMPREF1982_01691 [Clostridiales bacterium oral taxon 876 str. F0540]|nr:hypothetical protein HMPREF1982_01691 [Clostridiales bacterium oral taxon 876 str. F0540]
MEKLFCQSCGMPMNEEVLGTNSDGTKNTEYCIYCYKEGSFTSPNTTLEQMIEECVPFMKENGMEEAEARRILNDQLPKLKRWSK